MRKVERVIKFRKPTLSKKRKRESEVTAASTGYAGTTPLKTGKYHSQWRRERQGKKNLAARRRKNSGRSILQVQIKEKTRLENRGLNLVTGRSKEPDFPAQN